MIHVELAHTYIDEGFRIEQATSIDVWKNIKTIFNLPNNVVIGVLIDDLHPVKTLEMTSPPFSGDEFNAYLECFGINVDYIVSEKSLNSICNQLFGKISYEIRSFKDGQRQVYFIAGTETSVFSVEAGVVTWHCCALAATWHFCRQSANLKYNWFPKDSFIFGGPTEKWEGLSENRLISILPLRFKDAETKAMQVLDAAGIVVDLQYIWY